MDTFRETLQRLQKTPAMYLQEVCTKDGCSYQTAEKDLRSSASAEPRFEITLSVANFNGKDYQGTGTARNKKDAKQEAALNLLRKMLTPKDMLEIGISSSNASEQCVSTVPTALTPIPAQLSGSDISSTICQDIIDLCAKKGLPNPEYNELGACGPPHLREFTYECRIKLGDDRDDLVAIVKAGQKQKAKRMAAAEMIVKVRGEVATRPTTSVDGLSSASRLSIPIEKINLCDNRQRCHELFAHDHHRFHSFQGSAIKGLHESEMKYEEEKDYRETLNEVAKEEGFKVEYDIFPGRNHDDQIQCVCKMAFTFNRYSSQPTVIFGSGSNESSAYSNAAFQTLQFLKAVTNVSAPVG